MDNRKTFGRLENCSNLFITQKGDKRDRNNYRGIALQSYRTWRTKFSLLTRIKEKAEQTIGKYQRGFKRSF